MRVANLISFSWTSFRFDLYSFSSSVSSFFSFAVRSPSLALFLSSLTFSLLLMIVSMMLSPSAAPAFDPLDRCHRLGVVEDATQRVVVDVHQQSALPLASQQGCGGAGHGDVEDPAGVDLRHVRAVVGEHRQERDELLDGLLRVRLVRRQSDAVVGELTQSPRRREVEHEADRLEDLFLVWVVAVGVLDRPGD